MAGIYIHIPFCKQACHYCNFHFSTSLRQKTELVSAICREIEIRAAFLNTLQIETIYFGGGTPSLLEMDDLTNIFQSLARHFEWDASAEITLEANPDDINAVSLDMWQSFGINRLSVGVQSFHDVDLQFMNRAHSAAEAHESLILARHHGFEHFSIDLIYGSPTTTNEMWTENLKIALALAPQHISSYALTVEPKTALAHQIKVNPTIEPKASHAATQFDLMVRKLTDAGFEHYEISNFGLPGHHALHNTNYWKGVHYLGLGPSAHSYDGTARYWNIAHNKKYVEALSQGSLPLEKEELSLADRYNETIMTGLRTMWGVSLTQLKNIGNQFSQHMIDHAQMYIDQGHMTINNDHYILTEKGKLFADGIASDLFWVDED